MSPRLPRSVVRALPAAICLGAALAWPVHLFAGNKKNPTSKFFVADVDGDAEIDTGDRVDELNKKSVYNAEGTVVETKEKAADAMVFSNGTGIFFDEDTRLEVKKFEQEPFVPNRTDMDVEPSISQTQAYVPRGTVGLCTSKLVAGSSMNYRTPIGSVNIRGGKVVIENKGNQTKISMLEGDSTVSTGNVNLGGQQLKDGEQAVITAGVAGQPAQISIQRIPPAEAPALEAKVTMACTAKKTVYFEARGTPSSQSIFSSAPVASGPTTKASAQATEAPIGNGSMEVISGPITAFDGDSATASLSTFGTTTIAAPPPQQIVAVPVTTVTIPVQNPNDPSTSTITNPS